VLQKAKSMCKTIAAINFAVGFLSAVTFLEYWKRKTADLGHRWDCLDFQDEEVRYKETN